ncbi:MAG: response regulator transcription factor [Acholeplasmatales bacterium]|nr:response regulator transcription factor [Acholeplasmatales bacterium]
MNYLIYSVEDDKDIALIINKTLSKQGYIVKTFYNAKSFFEAFNNEKPDIILLDMMLPDMSGSEILKNVRGNKSNEDIQIIIISANHMIMDKVDGLDLGADDYIEKPFDLLELMSRVQARARRIKKKQSIYETNGIILNIDKRICLVDNNEIELTNKEFEILTLLIKNEGNVVTRDEIFLALWGTSIVESRTLDMHIKSLRSKLLNKQDMIKTVYGVGYKLTI